MSVTMQSAIDQRNSTNTFTVYSNYKLNTCLNKPRSPALAHNAFEHMVENLENIINALDKTSLINKAWMVGDISIRSRAVDSSEAVLDRG